VKFFEATGHPPRIEPVAGRLMPCTGLHSAPL
jgi:hypothetical protein